MSIGVLSASLCASAATWTVSNTNDSGTGSLREAITEAGAGDSVVFASNVTGTITLTSGELAISKDLRVAGPGASHLVISGGGASRVFAVTGGAVALSGLTITQGSAYGVDGGAVYVQGGSLALNDSAVTNSVVSGAGPNDYGGGGLFFGGGVNSLTRCTVNGNAAVAGYGGGLALQGGSLTVADCTFSGNTARNSTAPGTYGAGGALYSSGAFSALNCTFSSNAADEGGGLYTVGDATLTNCTLSGNSSSLPAEAGGLAAAGSSGSLVVLTACLVAGNMGGDVSGSLGVVTSSGSNLIGDIGGLTRAFAQTGDQSGTSSAPLDPKLGPLQDNGGPVPTMALQPGSPAIDADLEGEDPDHRRPPLADARGLQRPQGARSDIGAYEVPALTTAHAHLLWTQSGGAMAVWTVDVLGDVTSTPAFGPFSGWSARALAVDAVGAARVLWNRDGGEASVWVTGDTQGDYTSTPGYGPFSGWTATAVASGEVHGDGFDALPTRLLWNNVSGEASVWTVNNADGTFTSTPGYGPYPGWTATTLALVLDGSTRLLWNNVSGEASVWTVNNADGTFTSTPGYGPYPGWTARALAVDPDSFSRLLWVNVSGEMAVWTIAADGTFTSTPGYGPYPGWSATALAAGPDRRVRVLWSHVSGEVSVWTINADGSYTSTPGYGPIPGWSAIALSAGA